MLRSQVLVRDGLDLNIGQCHRLQPAQDAQPGVGVAQTIEHHDADQRLNIDAVAGAAKDAAQIGEAELFPQLAQGPHMAQGAG